MILAVLSPKRKRGTSSSQEACSMREKYAVAITKERLMMKKNWPASVTLKNWKRMRSCFSAWMKWIETSVTRNAMHTTKATYQTCVKRRSGTKGKRPPRSISRRFCQRIAPMKKKIPANEKPRSIEIVPPTYEVIVSLKKAYQPKNEKTASKKSEAMPMRSVRIFCIGRSRES